ncbi:uncharacterized protein LOC126630078 [Malus sylvestris]|uniref:uncharacterized protein LOC126630078 n=1 Tax=Malus sylvestris TaxID=3752 RepID=UPI0021ACE395|nr:uncharacterized protein LOC126630078 [Malus sylvestris]
MEHILLLCTWVSRVWIGSLLSSQINRSSITILAEWLYVVINQNMGCKEDLNRSMEYLVFTCWFIWRARCDAIFNGVKPSPFKSNQVIITALESFKHAFSSLLLSSTIPNSLPRGMHHLALWSPPPINRIKVNVDACWKRDSLCGKIRIVARDSFSGCKAVKSVWVHVSSAGMAEALAVLEGCLLAKCLQEQEVVIESDAQGVIWSLNSPSLSCD